MPLLAASVFLTPIVARADSYEPAPISLSDLYAKVRTARGLLAPGSYVQHRKIHRGEVDLTSTTYRDGADWVTTTEGGGYTTSSGGFHGQTWWRDDNGIVIRDSNFDARDNQNTVAFLRPAIDPNVKLLGVTSDTHQLVVEAKPPGGVDEYRYYNAATYLLERIVRFGYDRYRSVTDYSDYRDTFGFMMPYKVHSYDGRPQNDDTYETTSYEKNDSPVDYSIPISRPLFTLFGSGGLRLPAHFTRSGIIVRLDVDGRGLDFLLDSGASGLCIDPGVAHELGRTPFGRSSITIGGGDIDDGKVRLSNVSIGALRMSNVVFRTTPMSWRSNQGDRIVGLLGFDFFASAIVGIDFQAKTVIVYPKATFDPTGLNATPLQLDDGLARAAITTDGVAGHFAVDTGATFMSATNNYINKLPYKQKLGDLTIGTIGGPMAATEREVNNISFAGTTFKRGSMVVTNSSTFDFRNYDGLVGRNALAFYKIFFDYPDQILYTAPADGSSGPY